MFETPLVVMVCHGVFDYPIRLISYCRAVCVADVFSSLLRRQFPFLSCGGILPPSNVRCLQFVCKVSPSLVKQRGGGPYLKQFTSDFGLFLKKKNVTLLLGVGRRIRL